jgi:hypothetical protein
MMDCMPHFLIFNYPVTLIIASLVALYMVLQTVRVLVRGWPTTED